MLLKDVKGSLRNAHDRAALPERVVVSLEPNQPSRGSVLLCWANKGFLVKPGQPMPNGHTSYWESVEIANAFLDLGYDVDVIHENNSRFVPAKPYSFFIGNRTNFDRIVASLGEDCLKILHIDAAHWLFNNTAEHLRLQALQRRRGVALSAQRFMRPNRAIEHADCATVLGNEFTISTYQFADKLLHRLPISAPAVYPWPEGKDFDRSCTRFLWIGSGGMVHKGLDLVLEAFADLPDCHLTVCGPIDGEKDFESVYHSLLYATPNIRTVGWVDIAGPTFLEITRNCVGVVYPSCSEGGGGSVISCMHAGLIPIVSREASVDVDRSFGLVLKDCSIEEIRTSVREVSNLSSDVLEAMSRRAWDFARAHHTKETFSQQCRTLIAEIVNRPSHWRDRQLRR
jgi:glycosyltransferase involved in cell wall biosynthesis